MGIDELLDKNMEFASVIRSLRKNAREDAEQIARLERERDEAREKAERYRLEANSLMLQRDEAREAMREMWQSGDAFLPYIDNETTNRWRKAAGWEETK